MIDCHFHFHFHFHHTTFSIAFSSSFFFIFNFYLACSAFVAEKRSVNWCCIYTYYTNIQTVVHRLCTKSMPLCTHPPFHTKTIEALFKDAGSKIPINCFEQIAGYRQTYNSLWLATCNLNRYVCKTG